MLSFPPSFWFDSQYATSCKIQVFLNILQRFYKEIVFYISAQNVSEFFLKSKYKMIVILDSFKIPSAVKKTVKIKMKK